jgi:DNA repair protein RecN (Recombination protein N)
MLRELHISNLAVIADARIEFDRGLNCFTGTTGAGKSLVIGAIEMLLGLRSTSDMLRSGVDEGRVSGVFELHDPALLKRLEALADLPLSDDGGELLLTRRLFASGRSSVSLNGHPITLTMLKQLAEALIDVHGQHDHQYLLKPGNQLVVLDQFAGLTSLRGEYEQAYSAWRAAEARLSELIAGRTLREQQLDLYRFQAQEIDAAEVQPGEYEELQARASVLGNLEKIKKDATAAHSALYDADGSILERLKMLVAVLAELGELDATIKPTQQACRDATLQLEEAAFDLGRYLDKLDLDPAELGEVSERLNVLHRLLHKYGDTVDDLLHYRRQIGEQIEQLEQQTDDLESLQSSLKPLHERAMEIARQLNTKRQSAAERLAPMIEGQLADLGMSAARFSIQVAFDADQLGTTGADAMEFLIQTNPGLPMSPLRKVASGGELSRVMLALKSVFSQGDRVSVLVFDEIDSNVGGRLGAIIGGKLRELARHHQVLCITHLPQIAAYADRHLTVRKVVEGNKTTTGVAEMRGEERLREIAEMIGGQKITPTTLAQAQELLDAAAPPAAAKRRSKSAR